MTSATPPRTGVTWRALAAIALALACAGALAQPRYDLAPEVYEVFRRWLASSCIEGEERALVAEMRRYVPALAAAFRKAATDGPPADELAAVRAAAEERFDARAKFPLDDYKIDGISRKDLDAFRRVTPQQFVDDQVRRYALGYRSNALAGLGVVGGAEARAFLTRLARNRADPLAPAAREALKNMPPPKQPPPR